MKFLIVIVLMISCLFSFGQEYKMDMSSIARKKVSILTDRVDLDIQSHSGSDLIISTDHEYTIPDRAKGLKPLYNDAEDNTGIGLEIKQTDQGIIVRRATSKDMYYTMKIPKNADIYIELGFQSDDVALDGFTGEVEIDAKISDVTLTNVQGPCIVDLISGDIVVKYGSAEIKGPSTLNTVSGEIDVTLPKTAKLDLELSTVTGEVYVSDPAKFKSEKQDEKGLYHMGGQNMKTKYNGGGPDLNLVTVSGNIYLREK